MSNQITGKEDVVVTILTDILSRIEYKEHVIQTYGYVESGNPDIQIMYFIIDEYGGDVREETCLVEALLFIDKKVGNRDRKLATE